MQWQDFNRLRELPNHPVMTRSPFPLEYDGFVEPLMRYGTPGFKSDAATFLFSALKVHTSFPGSNPRDNVRENMTLHDYVTKHMMGPTHISHHDRTIWGPGGGDFYHQLNPRSLSIYNCTVHKHTVFNHDSAQHLIQGYQGKHGGINLHKHSAVGNHLVAGRKLFLFYPPTEDMGHFVKKHVEPYAPAIHTLYFLMRNPWLPQPRACVAGPGTFTLAADEWWHMTFNLERTFGVGCTDLDGCDG